MNELIYPTLDLFIYDRRDGLGENDTEIVKNQKYFLRRLPERDHKLLKQQDSEKSEYVELLGNRGRETFDSSTTHYSLKGWVYPVGLGDSYGLLIDCSVEHSLVNVEKAKNEAFPVSCFTDLKAEIEERLANTPSTIGQVWMLSGQLSNFNPDNAEIIVKECSQVSALNLNWDLDYRGKTPFLTGILFEFWRYYLHIPSELPESLNIHDIQDNHYVIVAIYPDTSTAQKASEFNFDWLRLFAYRSKILYSYGQSQYLRKKLHDNFINIEKYQNNFNQARSGKLKLQELRQTLVDAQDTLWNYSLDLNYLLAQKRTIEVNLLNYERRLERINQKLTNFKESSNLKCLNDFIEDVNHRYLEQIKNDYESLNIGLELLNNLINSIRGLTEIESSERDRNFQSTIAIVGVGLAASSLVASITGQFPGAADAKQAAKYPVGSLISHMRVPEPWLPPAVSVTISLGVGILAALVTWLGIRAFECFRGSSVKRDKMKA